MSSSKEGKPKPIAFGDRGLSDVTLVVEKQEFLVHKMVLASRSDVFKAMLYGQFKEANKGRIEIKEVPVTAFQSLLEILYYRAVKNRGKLFPGTCNGAISSPTNEGRYRKSVIDLIWCSDSLMLQLLKVADRFNLTDMVMHELKDVFGQFPCKCEECFRCMSIYFLLVDRDWTIKIPRAFTRDNRESLVRAVAVEKREVLLTDISKMRIICNLFHNFK